MILIIIFCDYVGSVHSMTLKCSDVDDSEEEDDFEGDKEKKSLDASEEAHI